MIYIRTTAYNAEKTLQRTIDSILNQTYTDFRYYILDNGSKDSTGEIIRANAKKDARIQPFYGKINRNYKENPEFALLSHNINDEDYFVIIDADDYYEPTFLEEMIAFIKANNLDLAACGTRFFDAESGEKLGSVVLDESVVVDSPDTYNKFFSKIHWNLRQAWGKLYSGKVAKERCEIEVPDDSPKGYGGDTYNVLRCMKKVERFGVYGKILHNYAISSASVSYTWQDGRDKADLILHNMTREFLLDKAGVISDCNRMFLNVVYENAIVDTLKVLTATSVNEAWFWKCVNDIFWNENTIMALLDSTEIIDGGRSKRGVLGYKDALLKFSLEQAGRREVGSWTELLKFYKLFNEQIDVILPDGWEVLAVNNSELFSDILNKKYGSVANWFITKKNDDLNLVYILTGVNIFALLESQEMFIEYSKKKIKKMVELGFYNDARTELSEWLEICSEDIDFIEIRNSLEGK